MILGHCPHGHLRESCGECNPLANRRTRYFLPICVRGPQGFYGGPSGYKEVTEAEKDDGPVIEEVNADGD